MATLTARRGAPRCHGVSPWKLRSSAPPHLTFTVLWPARHEEAVIYETIQRVWAVETFATLPINKPHGLNVGLHRTSNQVVTIFDAEDDIDPNIFNIVNTVMVE